MPVLYSFLATTMLVSFNIEAIAGTIHVFYPYLPVHSKYYALILILAIGLMNYFILYRNKYYETVFNDFDLYKVNYKRWDLSVKVYIISSILILLVTLVLADLKNHGRL